MKLSIITKHDITLRSSCGEYDVELVPLTDEHLPLLYKWNSDPEVLYYADSDIVESYSQETVNSIYSNVSKNAFCFLIKANGIPIGDCWLQKMNINKVLEKYPAGTDVRRIDMCIGEKSYWGKGIGTIFVKMLVDFAFTEQSTDLLHCFVESYNPRSARVFEKNGFTIIKSEKNPEGSKGEFELHLRLTKEEYKKGKC
ncbi:MAG: GNAT family N-acetyltransferase [Clostridiales bacterium]|nr:GNAT family N-acetyltransferase [Clostridiales bacterium]